MSKKRKIPRPVTGRSVMENLRYIGFRVNHPLLINDLEAKEPRRRSTLSAPPPASEEFHRYICFTGIPASVLHAKGHGTSNALAEEHAAHSMLDFFRSAISPHFVNQLCACQDEQSIDVLIPAVHEVFMQFELAVASDFLSINRCTQLELTSSACLRGREAKKRVLANLKTPSLGYAPPGTVTQGVPQQQEKPKKQVMVVPSGRNDVEVVTLDDDDEEEEQPLVDVEEKEQSPSGDLIVMKEKIVVVKKETKKKKEAMKTPPRRTSPPKKPASPAVQTMRKGDQEQMEFYKKQRDAGLEERRREEPVDSTSYFGELNTSLQGPSDVFCCIPNTNAHRYTEAVSSEDEDEESSEGEAACPSKRAKMGAQGDEVVVLNTVSMSAGPHMMRNNGNGVVQKSPEVKRKITESEETAAAANADLEEIGDIVDEWEEKEEITEEPSTSLSFKEDPHDGFYAGYASHREMIKAMGQPVNYQAKTLGVVLNEQMVYDVETFVESVSERATESVKRMSQQVWDHYQFNSQTDSVMELKAKARTMLFGEFQKLFPDKCVSLQITGSTINGCGSFNSDVDMCFCFPTNGYRGNVFDDFACERSQSNKVLRKLDKAIRRCKPGQPLRKYIKHCEMIPAKVPIVKLVLQGEFQDMEVDINVNNIAGIYNSHLTHYYSLIDFRFPSLSLAIKHWASRRGVANAQQGYLNSYTIILLVVHFLQCGVTPAVLPNLQYLFPEKFDKKLPISALQLYGDITERLPIHCPNTWSTGELFIGFFYYYSHFDFANNAISIRSAQVVPRQCLPAWTANAPIFIEEPFDAVNTARSVRTANHMNFIKKEFRRAKAIFQQNKFTMKDVGVVVADVPGREEF